MRISDWSSDVCSSDLITDGDESDGIDSSDDLEDGPSPAVVSVGLPGTASEREEEDEHDDMLRPLPDRLVTELTTHRTLALRDAVARSHEVAFAAVLHALVLDTFYSYSSSESCVPLTIRVGSLGVQAPGINDSAVARAIDERHKVWSDRLPDAPSELWAPLGALDAETQTALFAHCAPSGTNDVSMPAP